MRILIVGAGSTGGYFGGRLAAAGRDVTFLVRPGRARQLAERGLEIVSPHGDLTLAPRTVTADALDGPFDAILLTVKAYSLEPAMADIARAVGPGTVILPVLNGMRHMDALAERFGAAAVAGCACKISSHLDESGRIVQFTPLQALAYGERDGTPSPRIQALDRALQGAGFDARLSPDIMREMWEKWILLATVGSITCLARGDLKEVSAAPGGMDLILRIYDEVVAVVRAVGHPPAEEFVARARQALTVIDSLRTTSMYRDLQGGASIEGDQIVGDLVARGRRAGVPVPLLEAAYTNLAVYQARRAG